MISQESVEQLRRLMELRQTRDEAKAALKNAEDEYRDAETDVYESLEENPVRGTIKVDLGEPWGVVAFAPRETYYGQIIDDEEALDYYSQRAMIDEVSAPKFVMRRINEEVRDCIEQGRDLPPGITYYARRGVTITRQKG